jgi:hypothetical protein
VNRPYTTSGLNQHSAAGGASSAYDANGNLTSNGATTHVHDIEHGLVLTSAGATRRYDPLGRL